MNELWKPVPVFDKYHVSNFGRFKSFHKGKTKILKPAPALNGYLQVGLCKDNQQKNFLVHRLVALAFIPNPNGKPQINHRDGNKLNNHVSNLEWCTPSENQRHAYDTGLSPLGEEHGRAKLTNEQARYVRSNPDGLSIYKLAEMFSVYPTKISAIQLGKTYQGAGGVVRKAKPQPPRVPDSIREQIRAEYVRGSAEFGSYGLAEKYGVAQKTILKIVKET